MEKTLSDRQKACTKYKYRAHKEGSNMKSEGLKMWACAKVAQERRGERAHIVLQDRKLNLKVVPWGIYVTEKW